MNLQASHSRKTSCKSLLRAIAIAAVALSVTISFSACGKAKSWAPRETTDITVESPYALGPGPDLKGKLPQKFLDSMEYFETYDTGEGTNPRVMITRMGAKPGIPVSLDGAMNGAMNGGIGSLGNAAGGTSPQFTSSSLKIDGLEARKASYTGQAQGKSIHLDGVFVQNGQKMWQVQIITLGDSSAADIARIADSVHIKADPGK